MAVCHNHPVSSKIFAFIVFGLGEGLVLKRVKYVLLQKNGVFTMAGHQGYNRGGRFCHWLKN